MTDKVNISSIVSSQFPSFIREDYEAFVAFVKAYYEFLQQDYSTDLKTIRDIDTTLDEYVKHFKSEYASNIPFTLANERFVLSNIKDLNLAKGSDQSYRLLFRLLFDKEIAIGYPGQQMLRASDGRWEQKVSIFVGIVAGNVDKIVNNVVDIVTSTGPIKTLVYSYKNLQLNIDGRDVYELSIDRRFFGNIAIDDRVTLDGDFIARIVPTIAKFNVVQSGKNFRVGELYEIGTTGTILKIVETDIYGAIVFAQIIKYDMDTKFTDDFIYELISKTDLAKQLAIPHFSITVPGADGTGGTPGISASKDVGLSDATDGFTDEGMINSFDYNVDVIPAALDGTYSGKIFRTWLNEPVTEKIDTSLLAYINFSLGGVSKYPGFYTSNNGFLDDAMFIQDSKFYQIYSYLLTIDEKLDTYKSAVKTLLHPSGVALFGEYSIINELDLSTELESTLKSLIIILKDSMSVQDRKDHFDVAKALPADLISLGVVQTYHLDRAVTVDTLDPLVDGTTNLFGKSVSDAVEFTDDSRIFDLIKGLSDAPEVTDTEKYFHIEKSLDGLDSISLDVVQTYHLDRAVTVDTLDPLSDETTNLFGKIVSDTIEFTDDSRIFDLIKGLSDTQGVVDTEKYLHIEKSLDGSDSISLSHPPVVKDLTKYMTEDEQIIADSGILYLNPYLVDMTTFADTPGGDYMDGGRRTF
jgi:hypothetical protein